MHWGGLKSRGPFRGHQASHGVPAKRCIATCPPVAFLTAIASAKEVAKEEPRAEIRNPNGVASVPESIPDVFLTERHPLPPP